MSVKVFCLNPLMGGYQTEPPDTFEMTVNYVVYRSNNGSPTLDNGSVNIHIPIGTSPYAVYSQIYQHIYDFTVQLGEPATKNDIFGYVPTPFSVLLPDLPSFT
jgi:hypothetical protein